MIERLLWALVGYYLLTGLYISLLPLVFYENAPGVADTGPYNMHFLRDVGFAFTLSSVALAYGLRQRLKPVLVFGAAWLIVHGLFHLTLWVIHGLSMDAAALIDLLLVVVPALLLAGLVWAYGAGSTH